MGRSKVYPAIAGVIAFGACLRIAALLVPAWYDETLTLYMARQPFGRMWELALSVRDLHSPLFTLLVHPFARLWPSLPFLRLLPLAAGIAQIYFLYKTGEKVGGRRAGIWAALFFACAAPYIHFSVQLRSYSLLVLASLASVYYFLELAEGFSPRRAMKYAAATVACVWLHHVGILTFLIEACVWHFYFRPKGEEASRWLRAFAAIALCALPAICLNLFWRSGQYAQVKTTLFPLKPSLVSLRAFLVMFFRGTVMTLLVLGMTAFAREQWQRRHLALLTAMFLVPLALFLAVTFTVRSLLDSWRYMLPFVVYYYVFAGMAFASFKGRMRFAAITVTACFGALSVFSSATQFSADVRQARAREDSVAALRRLILPGDAVAICDRLEAFSYLNDLRLPLKIVTTPGELKAEQREFAILPEEAISGTQDLRGAKRLVLIVSGREGERDRYSWLEHTAGITLSETIYAGRIQMNVYQLHLQGI